MRKFTATLALLGLLSSGPAMAAEDLRIAPQSQALARGPSTGFGAALTIGLGHHRRAEASQMMLSIGPTVRSGGRQSVADLGRLTLSQKGALDLRLAGQSLLGAADGWGARDSGTTHKGPSTGGWVAIALGAVALVGGIAVLAVARNVQDE